MKNTCENKFTALTITAKMNNLKHVLLVFNFKFCPLLHYPNFVSLSNRPFENFITSLALTAPITTKNPSFFCRQRRYWGTESFYIKYLPTFPRHVEIVQMLYVPSVFQAGYLWRKQKSTDKKFAKACGARFVQSVVTVLTSALGNNAAWINYRWCTLWCQTLLAPPMDTRWDIA